MRPLHKIILVILILVCITCDEAPDSPPKILAYEQSALEQNLVQLINNYRTQHNLMVVSQVDHISALAYEHNVWMINYHITNHSYFHNRASSIEAVLNVERIGEIIAYNYQTNASVISAWLSSPPHKVILDDNRYGYVGLAITQDTITNRKYYTVIFAGD